MAEQGETSPQERLITPSSASMAMEPDLSLEEYSARLHRSAYIAILTLGYAAAATYAWVITCIVTYRPIGGRHYGVATREPVYNDSHLLYAQSERYYRTARVVQSIVAVLTIPLTSAVCARAAVTFLQYGKQCRGMTMRRTMVLADKSWNDPSLIAKLVLGQWKRYGSPFLAGVILLNLLGGILSPLQEAFLTTTSIKTPTASRYIPELVDFANHFRYSVVPDFDNGYAGTLARGKLASTRRDDPQMRLWSGAINCDPVNTTGVLSSTCTSSGGQHALGSIAELHDPFWSQLPSGYSTGLIRQYAPRINSTATRLNITEADFPKNCDQIPDAFYIRYANETPGYSYYSIEACMPGNVSSNPWKSTYQRQDFSEEMYLNISVHYQLNLEVTGGTYYSKITLNTTGGYFELPNYMNGEVAGPLLADGPGSHCGLDCLYQGYKNNSAADSGITSRSLASGGTAQNITVELSDDPNKGPLLIIAEALFGLGSFLDTLQNSEAYIDSAFNQNLTGQCFDLIPFAPLLSSYDQASIHSPLQPCREYNHYGPGDLETSYLWMFAYDSSDTPNGDMIRDGFTAAAFIANEAWMLSTDGTITVSYDLGEDTEVPVISRVGIILVSSLLCLDLVCLLALALYSAQARTWTSQLDAFAMMRIGAAMSDKLPSLMTQESDCSRVLEETPGWIGDATGGEGSVGELAIGARACLKGRRKYRRDRPKD